MALKPKVNSIYLCPSNGLFRVTHINIPLLAMSVNNKAITVEYLDTKEEYVLAWAYLQDSSIKYLGDNADTARILYEKSVRPIKGEPSILLKFMGMIDDEHQLSHYQDPAEILEAQQGEEHVD